MVELLEGMDKNDFSPRTPVSTLGNKLTEDKYYIPLQRSEVSL